MLEVCIECGRLCGFGSEACKAAVKELETNEDDKAFQLNHNTEREL